MKNIYLLAAFFLCSSAIFSQWNNDPAVNTLVANSMEEEDGPVSISDGAGGSILFFSDGYKIWTRKISDAGIVTWGTAPQPVLLTNTTDVSVYDLAAIPDGSGGAFVAYLYSAESSDFAGINLQHISSSGALLFGASGITVSNAVGQDNYFQSLCPDGAGGVIVGWSTDNYVDDTQLYAQRYNATGTALWVAGGIKVCTAAGFRAGLLVPDGSNGAIALFYDTRNDPNGLDYEYLNEFGVTNTDLFAQRLNANGQKLWAADGVAISTAAGNQYLYSEKNVINDASGNVILTFFDGRNSTLDENGEEVNSDIYAQKINSSGASQWTANGVAVATQQGNQQPMTLVTDGAGGAVLLYTMNEFGGDWQIQRIASNGTQAWANDGLSLPVGDNYYISPSLAADGLGNTIYATFTVNPDFTSSIRAQKLNAAGVAQWAEPGTLVGSFVPSSAPAVVSSTAGSVIIGWGDDRNSATTQSDIYASKVLANGTLAGSAVTSEYISATTGNWNNPATWVGGVVPPADAKVIVRHLVTVNVNISCYSLKVEQPTGQIKVNTNIVVNIMH